MTIPISISACKSSLGTAKKLRLDRTWTGSGPEIPRTGKDRNRGPVFGLSLLGNFEDQLKPVLTGLHSLKGEFRPFPNAPSHQNARRGHFYPPHTSLSCFDAMGVSRPLPNAPLVSKCETGAFPPTPYLPLAFRHDGGFRPFPNCPLTSKREMGGISTHPTPPSRVSTQCG